MGEELRGRWSWLSSEDNHRRSNALVYHGKEGSKWSCKMIRLIENVDWVREGQRQSLDNHLEWLRTMTGGGRQRQSLSKKHREDRGDRVDGQGRRAGTKRRGERPVNMTGQRSRREDQQQQDEKEGMTKIQPICIILLQ